MTPPDYLERVYAGVLGKIIGVYAGRPIEQWSFERITERFGEVDRYVHQDLGAHLVVADDDISGTFTFLRALPDNGNDSDITPESIGNTWLNYIIEDRTILWWGGMGISTEHTAFLRLKNGIKSPASGSTALNAQVVAEQIGAQIFIDGWGMICPGDPERAVDFARRAGSVSHDGEAIYGAQVVAALVSAAFIESDIDCLLDTAGSFIPRDCVIARVIADVRAWHAETPEDWRATRAKIADRYGYQHYGGGCHIVPNHALVIHALLHGDGDFSRSMMIVNTCGWDTDCNAANVGCILGVRGGLNGLEGGHDWRGPVADRLFLPTADSGRCITDALQEAVRIADIGRALAGAPPLMPKNGARFSFALPGSIQGFSCSGADVGNAPLPDGQARGLKISLHGASSEVVLVQTPTFLQPEELGQSGYELVASPTLYPGQILEANLIFDGAASGPISVRPFVRHFAEGVSLQTLTGPPQSILPGAQQKLNWTVPGTGRQPIASVGIEIVGAAGASSDFYLDSLTWSGTPTCELHRPEHGTAWQRAWMNGVSKLEFPEGTSGLRIIQNEGTGLVSQGTREWADYSVSVRASAHLCERFGLAARVQGLRRFYALILTHSGTAQLIKVLDSEAVVAETVYDWRFDQTYEFALVVRGNVIRASLDGQPILEFVDQDRPLDGGAIGVVCTRGNVFVETVQIAPVAD